eukprot:s758_g23.t1
MISTEDVQELEATLPGSPQHVPQCRFCLEESPVEELITPCKCEGTSRYVHEGCLRRWQGEALCYEHALVCQVPTWTRDSLGNCSGHCSMIFIGLELPMGMDLESIGMKLKSGAGFVAAISFSMILNGGACCAFGATLLLPQCV